jgi:hypothetical protein
MTYIHIFLEERFVSDAYSAPILVMLSLVLLELTEQLPSKCYPGAFSAIL